MEFYNGFDLLDEEVFKLTVNEDKNKLNGASTSTVRQHFRKWCGEARNREQGSNEEIARRRQGPAYESGSLAVRYRFCVQIDANFLQSIVHGSDRDCKKGIGPFANLIRDDWELDQWVATLPQPPDYNCDECEGDFEDEEYPPLETNTEEDVGYIRIDVGRRISHAGRV